MKIPLCGPGSQAERWDPLSGSIPPAAGNATQQSRAEAASVLAENTVGLELS